MGAVAEAPPLLLALASEIAASALASEAALLPLLARCSEREAADLRRAIERQDALRTDILRQHRQVVATLEAAGRYQNSPSLRSSATSDEANHEPPRCSSPPKSSSSHAAWQKQMLHRLHRYLKKQLRNQQKMLLDLATESQSIILAADQIESVRLSIRHLSSDILKVENAWKCLDLRNDGPAEHLHTAPANRSRSRWSGTGLRPRKIQTYSETEVAFTSHHPELDPIFGDASNVEAQSPIAMRASLGHDLPSLDQTASPLTPARQEIAISPELSNDLTTSPMPSQGRVDKGSSPIAICRTDIAIATDPLFSPVSSPSPRRESKDMATSPFGADSPVSMNHVRFDAIRGPAVLDKPTGMREMKGDTSSHDYLPHRLGQRGTSGHRIEPLRVRMDMPTPRVLDLAASPREMHRLVMDESDRVQELLPMLGVIACDIRLEGNQVTEDRRQVTNRLSAALTAPSPSQIEERFSGMLDGDLLPEPSSRVQGSASGSQPCYTPESSEEYNDEAFEAIGQDENHGTMGGRCKGDSEEDDGNFESDTQPPTEVDQRKLKFIHEGDDGEQCWPSMSKDADDAEHSDPKASVYSSDEILEGAPALLPGKGDETRLFQETLSAFGHKQDHSNTISSGGSESSLVVKERYSDHPTQQEPFRQSEGGTIMKDFGIDHQNEPGSPYEQQSLGGAPHQGFTVSVKDVVHEFATGMKLTTHPPTSACAQREDASTLQGYAVEHCTSNCSTTPQSPLQAALSEVELDLDQMAAAMDFMIIADSTSSELPPGITSSFVYATPKVARTEQHISGDSPADCFSGYDRLLAKISQGASPWYDLDCELLMPSPESDVHCMPMSSHSESVNNSTHIARADSVESHVHIQQLDQIQMCFNDCEDDDRPLPIDGLTINKGADFFTSSERCSTVDSETEDASLDKLLGFGGLRMGMTSVDAERVQGQAESPSAVQADSPSAVQADSPSAVQADSPSAVQANMQHNPSSHYNKMSPTIAYGDWDCGELRRSDAAKEAEIFSAPAPDLSTLDILQAQEYNHHFQDSEILRYCFGLTHEPAVKVTPSISRPGTPSPPGTENESDPEEGVADYESVHYTSYQEDIRLGRHASADELQSPESIRKMAQHQVLSHLEACGLLETASSPSSTIPDANSGNSTEAVAMDLSSMMLASAPDLQDSEKTICDASVTWQQHDWTREAMSKGEGLHAKRSFQIPLHVSLDCSLEETTISASSLVTGQSALAPSHRFQTSCDQSPTFEQSASPGLAQKRRRRLFVSKEFDEDLVDIGANCGSDSSCNILYSASTKPRSSDTPVNSSSRKSPSSALSPSRSCRNNDAGDSGRPRMQALSSSRHTALPTTSTQHLLNIHQSKLKHDSDISIVGIRGGGNRHGHQDEFVKQQPSSPVNLERPPIDKTKMSVEPIKPRKGIASTSAGGISLSRQGSKIMTPKVRNVGQGGAHNAIGHSFRTLNTSENGEITSPPLTGHPATTEGGTCTSPPNHNGLSRSISLMAVPRRVALP